MSPHARRSRWRWLLVACYIGIVVLVVWGLLAARRWALTDLATPEAVSDWQAWREDVRQQQEEPSPVRHRVPKSTEPPALVLMRDHFAVMLAGAVVLSTVLYWITAWLVVGALTAQTGSFRDRHSRR